LSIESSTRDGVVPHHAELAIMEAQAEIATAYTRMMEKLGEHRTDDDDRVTAVMHSLGVALMLTMAEVEGQKRFRTAQPRDLLSMCLRDAAQRAWTMREILALARKVKPG